MKGNEALCEGAISAGCRYYFGYPITPQNEVLEYFSRRLPEVGGVCLQAESEIAAISMVFGAAGAGARVMTSSSGPGISLKQEGISCLATAELPCVIANIMRGGPGLGGIQPAQSDYFQATRGGGHGDYRVITLAPASVQEMADLTGLAFELAETYRNPVLILGDGIFGQMMETLDLHEQVADVPARPWATVGCRGREQNSIITLYLNPEELEAVNEHLQEKYRTISALECRAETYCTKDAEVVVVAFGSVARIAKGSVDAARAEGIKAGLVRPVTLWPFPSEMVMDAFKHARAALVVEMNAGQMVEDVRLAANGCLPVYFYGRSGGMIPNSRAVLEKIRSLGGNENAKRIRPA